MDCSQYKVEYWLALDLASPVGSVSIHRFDKSASTLSELTFTQSQKHSEELLPSVDKVLREAKIVLSQVDRFLLPVGPGSFTGLRVGMAAVKAFSLVSSSPITTLNGTEIRALSWLVQNPSPLGFRLRITHRVAGDSTLVCTYEVESSAGVTLIAEEIVQGMLPLGDSKSIVLGEEETPMHARLLGEYYALAKQKRHFQSPEEIIALSPLYFGDKHFAT